jgi:hypothetical protein
MAAPDDIPLDLADPESIARAVPQIEAILASKRQTAVEANSDLEQWKALLKNLKSIAGLTIQFADPRKGSFPGPSPAAVEAVVRVVEQRGETMQPVGVERVLLGEGHDVEDREGVYAALNAAVAAGRLRQIGPRQFAPLSLRPSIMQNSAVIRAVPAAHFGLDGPQPMSKAEAVLRILGSDPAREWRAEDVGKVMIERSWMTESEKDFASLGAILSRLNSEGKIHRPDRGLYRLSPPAEARK